MTNILTLLFISQAWAEWVEISQQYYRKPIRTHSIFTTPDKVINVEDTTRPWTYNNRSVTEYNWNKSPARPSNIGNVKRVQLIGSTVKTTEQMKFEDEDADLDVEVIDYEVKPNYGPTKSTIEFNEYEKQKGTIKSVPNLGNIKRVQLSNSPVKSPAVNLKGVGEKSSNNRYKSGLRDEDLQPEINNFKDKNTETFNRRIYVNKIKKHGTERTATFPPYEDETTSLAQEATTDRLKHKNRTVVKNLYSTKPTFISETENLSNYETQQNRFYKITNSKTSEVTKKNYVLTTESGDTNEDGATKTNIIITKTTTEKSIGNLNKNAYNFKTESDENKVQASVNEEKQANIITNDLNTNTKGDNATPIHDQSENGKDEENKVIKDGTLKGVKTGSNNVNTMENVMKFMRVVADTISKNSRRSFGGKMQYLRELKDSILANIEERIESTWPDDDSAGARRRSRSAHASPRGHHVVHFPSSESALMTISFLTFAVFLIKLVLQVIQTYKHKAMMVAPVVVAASGRNVFTQRGLH